MPVTFPTLSIVDKIAGAFAVKGKAVVEAVGPWGTAKTLIAVQVAERLGCPLLILAAGRIEAEAIQDDLATLVGEEGCALFPAWEVLPTDTMNPADDIVAERMNALERLATAMEQDAPVHVVLPVRSLLQYVVHRKNLLTDMITVSTGEACDLEDLLGRLAKMGYERDVMVEQRGDFSVRGGIVDIFPISSELPYRLEFFGDEIDSIRRFEPETQRSIEQLSQFQILPRSEKAMLSKSAESGERLAAITSYLPKNALVVLDEPMAIRDQAEKLGEQFRDSRFHMPWDDAERHFSRFQRLSLAQVALGKSGEKTHRFKAPMASISGWAGHTGDFWDQLKRWDLDGYRVQLFCINTGERRRLYELLEEQGYRPGRDAFDLHVDIGRLRGGFASAADRLAVLSEREMFGRHYIRRKRRRFEAGAAITQFSDLKAGDFVVHADHGIGRYTGLRRFQGKAGDFMTIQYRGGDTMYVPVSHLDQVQKYAGGDGAAPKVDKLGGATWACKKARGKKKVRDMTEELVKLYAARENSRGHVFNADTPWQLEFEDAFEYEETPDQARAIRDAKRDMEAARPMDRLLCGDVGFGKTEVALRAAFKACMDGKQVALLAPTTVLTQQHYATFTERLADYPIRVELLNRFRTAKQQRETVERLKTGEVDIVIGTHRLTSKDIDFKDLGLVIIDEEQRFGVAHKEKLKQLRHHVDVLTLTATPIPRTLHFSLLGIRDMSTINTAPNDRLPIHTCIEVWDDNLIREAVERELARQGQVFFLHNRVQSIDRVAEHVQKLVPNARIAIGHGQMPKHQLEEVMAGFIGKRIDVLVCTTIIGSGIDIPNANTIIINHADSFGLSELYQIRGRVGRYKHRAFAYLLIPGDKALSEDAQQRLKALEEFSILGSGFRIAMRDLEIRGCGDILGAEQSGNIATVGYETYKDLIAESVAEQRGEPVKRFHLPPFDVAVDAFIPEEYIPTSYQKMALYRRIAAVHAPEEVDELIDELGDRFGAPPGPVLRLLDTMRARALAGELAVQSMAATKGSVTITFESAHFLDRDIQDRLRGEFGDRLQFAWKDQPAVTYDFERDIDSPVKETTRLLNAMRDL